MSPEYGVTYVSGRTQHQPTEQPPQIHLPGELVRRRGVHTSRFEFPQIVSKSQPRDYDSVTPESPLVEAMRTRSFDPISLDSRGEIRVTKTECVDADAR
jgi:hypothetical protein